MQSKQKDSMKTHCPYCDAVTNCKVLDIHDDIYDGPYWDETTTYALKCCGCEKAFIFVSHVYEDSVCDDDGNIIPDEKTYPKAPTSQHHTFRGDLEFGIDEDYNKGNFASDLYREISNAINADALIIATLGMRSLIDTACQIKLNPPSATNSEKQKTRGFAQNLEDLYSKGHITVNQKEILSDILELGHGATHRQTQASRKKVLIAIRIIEGILDSLFTMPKLGEELKKQPTARSNRL